MPFASIFHKKIHAPARNAMEAVDAVQLWSVRWTSRHGAFSHDTSEESEWFTSKESAERFALSLRNAFGLVRHTSQIDVKVNKEERDYDGRRKSSS